MPVANLMEACSQLRLHLLSWVLVCVKLTKISQHSHPFLVTTSPTSLTSGPQSLLEGTGGVLLPPKVLNTTPVPPSSLWPLSCLLRHFFPSKSLHVGEVIPSMHRERKSIKTTTWDHPQPPRQPLAATPLSVQRRTSSKSSEGFLSPIPSFPTHFNLAFVRSTLLKHQTLSHGHIW